MTDETIQLQHTSKAPCGFTHQGVSLSSDEDGIISIPSHLSGHATAHGFEPIADKPKAKKPLAKAAASDDDDEDKPAKEDTAKTVKGSGK